MTGNTKKRKITRLEEQVLKILGKKPLNMKLEETVDFIKTSNVKFGKRYSAPRSLTDVEVKPRNIMALLVLIVFVLCTFFAKNTSVLTAYFTDIKNLNNSFSVNAEYTVSFNSNTGTGSMPTQTVSYNVNTPLNSNTFTKEGYTFKEWNTSPNGTGTPYANGASINNLGDIELFAQWQAIGDCTITFNYGTESFDGTNYINSGIPLFNTDNIHRDFEVSATISNFVYNPQQDQDRNVFICNQYEAAAPYQGIALTYREGDSGAAIYVQGNCTTTGEQMHPWGKTSGTIVLNRVDDEAYYDNNYLIDFSNIRAPFTAPLTFGANIDASGNPRRYAIADMANMEIQLTYNLSEIPTLVLPTPTRTGYTFMGWYTQAVGGTKITTPTEALLADKTIYAHWSTEVYIVTFNANGGTGTMDNQVIERGVSTALDTNTFTKVGALFVEWNTAADGSGTPYSDEEVVTDIGNVTLYAQWNDPIYQLTFVFGDESFNGTNYIDSDIALFSTDNIHRHFDMTATFSNYQFLSGQSQNRNIFISNHYEAKNPYQGFSFCVRNGTIKAQGNSTKQNEKNVEWGQTAGDIEFERIDDKLYFNGTLVIDYYNIKGPFDQTMTFGASLHEDGTVIRYGKADFSDLQITLDYTYSELENLTLPAPTKVGYTFDGWYTAATGGTKLTNPTASQLVDQSIYARWIAN